MTATHQVPGLSLTPERVLTRRQTLGASEIAAVAGLDPYRSALDIWLEKTGRVAPFAGNQFTEWGLRLEAVVATKYGETFGVRMLPGEGTRHPTERWAAATPDRLVTLDDGEYLLEVKTKSSRQAVKWGEAGTDQVPHEIAAQCYWQMLCTGHTRVDVAVLFGGNEFRAYTIRQDPEIMRSLLDTGRAFWFDHVVADVSPALDGSESAHRYLAAKFAAHSDAMRTADPVVDGVARKLSSVRAELKEMEFVESALVAQLKHAIGDAAGITGPGWKITWKAPKATTVIDYKGLVARLAPDPALVAEFTSEKANSRRFLAAFVED